MSAALTTLVLANISFEFSCADSSTKDVDLFLKLVNLKNLTMVECSTNALIVFLSLKIF